jgi:hypothetical protein
MDDARHKMMPTSNEMQAHENPPGMMQGCAILKGYISACASPAPNAGRRTAGTGEKEIFRRRVRRTMLNAIFSGENQPRLTESCLKVWCDALPAQFERCTH